MASRSGVARGLATASVLLALAAGVLLATASCLSESVGSSSNSETGVERVFTDCHTLIGDNGAWILLYLAVPIVITGFGFIAIRKGHPKRALLLGILLLVLSLVAIFSIGLFYVPAAMVLLGSAAVSPD